MMNNIIGFVGLGNMGLPMAEAFTLAQKNGVERTQIADLFLNDLPTKLRI